MRRLPALLIAYGSVALIAAGAGCGSGGVSAGATVSVYVAAPLCNGAKRQLSQRGAAVEGLHVRSVCLPATEAGKHLDLARTGANARRATEDSTTVAFLESTGPGAKFSQTIVESAAIAWTQTSSGSQAMAEVLQALSDGSSSPRSKVREFLNGP